MQQVIKLTSFGTYKQKIGAGVHLAPKSKAKSLQDCGRVSPKRW